MAQLHSGRSLPARFTRYGVGSVIAFAASEMTLIVCFGTGILGPAQASVVAFFVGAVPNYVLNRSWVWKRRGRVSVRRELVPYVLVSVATLGIAALATSVAAALAPGGHASQTLFVAVAYFVTYAALFVVKFLVYQHFIFADRSHGNLSASSDLLLTSRSENAHVEE